MDPKQTEGQNGPSTLSTGANVSRTMDDLNVNDRKSATSNSPFAKHQFNKIAPGTGDIIIGQPNGTTSSAPGDKEPKINRGRLIQFGLIFGGIALVGLVIFTVVMVINNQPKTNNNSNTNNNSGNTIVDSSPRGLFSAYLEFLVDGPDGNSNETDEERAARIYDADFYAIIEIDKTVSDDRNDYVENLNAKWNAFVNVYDKEEVSSSRLADVSLYFYDYAKIGTLSDADIYDIFIAADKDIDTATRQIDDEISSSSTHPIIEYFVNIRRNYAVATLDVLSEADKNNCLSKETLFSSCNFEASDTLAKYTETKAILTDETSTKKKDVLLSNALIPLEDLEQEFYEESADAVSVKNEWGSYV